MKYLEKILLPLNYISTTTTHPRCDSQSYVPANVDCRDYSIPVAVISENLQWTGPRWTDNYELVDFLTVAASRSSASFYGNATEESGSYTIGATFCAPKHGGAKAKTVLVATHGLGYDRSYWNSAKDPEKYNFVQSATEQGYSVFFYDRVGVGSSSRISGYKTQPAIQTAILASLAKSLRQGKYTSPHIGTPTSLILIGHSFGSSISNAALAQVPSLANATVLTGFGLNGAENGIKLEGFAPRIARLQRPHEFASFDFSYVTTADVFAAITMYFKAPYYDRTIAHFGEATKQPFSIFEVLTVGATTAPEYKGPVLVISGEFDFPSCAGYCPGALNVDDGFEDIFPKVKALETYVQPGAGHVTNFAKNATGFYEEIFAFLERQGF